MRSEDNAAAEAWCLQSLDALHRAGWSEVPFDLLHVTNYLASALSPVWALSPTVSSVLKRAGLPFLPDIQTGLDALIRRGAVDVISIQYADTLGGSQVDATCRLNYGVAQPALDALADFPEELERSALLLEIGVALATSEDFTALFEEDASYSSPQVSLNRLVELAEPSVNRSTQVAELFTAVTKEGRDLAPGRKVALYLRHLDRLATGA